MSGGKRLKSRRYTYEWKDQNVIEVTDLKSDDFWYMNGCVGVLKRYDEEPSTSVANAYFEGYMAGVDWCDSQLRHSSHNFIHRE